jgi:hypothetical protein
MTHLRLHTLGAALSVLALTAGCSGSSSPNGGVTAPSTPATVTTGSNVGWIGHGNSVLFGATILEFGTLPGGGGSAPDGETYDWEGRAWFATPDCGKVADMVGAGDGEGMTLVLTGTEGDDYEIVIAGDFTQGGFVGTYTVTEGQYADACLPEPTGEVEFDALKVGGVNGVFTGVWDEDAPDPKSATWVLVETEDALLGTVAWDGYECSNGANLRGTVEEEILDASVESLDSKETNFSVGADLEAGPLLIRGAWGITKAHEFSVIWTECAQPRTGAFTIFAGTSAAPSTASVDTAQVIDLETGETRPHLILRRGEDSRVPHLIPGIEAVEAELRAVQP